MALHEDYMHLAIDEARKNFLECEGGPFGACIVRGSEVLGVARNTVLKTNDPTAHAEVNCIRLVSGKLGAFDLSGCVIYSTAEPCPMCFSAIHWARIDAVFYGASIADAASAGFNELSLSNQDIKRIGKSSVGITAGVLEKECVTLFSEWNALSDKQTY